MFKKKALVMSVLCAVASVGFVMSASAEETMSGQLDEVVIEAERGVLPGGMVASEDRVGILGSLDVLDVPFTQAKYSEKTINMFVDPNQSLNGVLANNPSIVVGSTGPMYTDFSMRGVNMNGNNYLFNNIPNLFNQSTYMPMGIVESVEVVSGPSTVINGSTNSNDGSNGYNNAPAGLVSAVTKKATDAPINRYTQGFSGRSTYSESIDIGRRFGKDKEWGVRVYGLMEKGGLSIHGAEKDEKAFYINIDHKDVKSTTNLFAGYYDRNITGGQMRLGTANLKNHLVDAPDGNSNFSFDGQIKDGRGYMATFNHEQKMNDNWEWFSNIGTGKYNEHKIDPTSGNIKIGDDGSLTGTLRNYKSESITVYTQAGVRGKVKTGEVMNNLTLAVDRSWTKSASKNASGRSIRGDIWNGVFNDGYVPSLPGFNAYSRETVVSTVLADRIEFGKMTAFVAAQFRDGKFTSSSDKTTSKSTVNPSYALSYKPVDNLTIYASHAQGYSRPFEVTGGYANDGTTLDPVKNKQNEFGVKYKTGSMLNTLSYFDFNKGNYIYEPVTASPSVNGDYNYTQDGENRYKGVEWTVTGKVAPKWNILGGAMWLNAKREKTGRSNRDGWFANGAPKWNAVLSAEYEADQNNSVVARMNYTGSTHITDTGLKTPAHMTFDLGYKHKTKLNGVGVTLNAMCYNLFDKNYWIGRESTVTLGTPRTLVLSAQFDI